MPTKPCVEDCTCGRHNFVMTDKKLIATRENQKLMAASLRGKPAHNFGKTASEETKTKLSVTSKLSWASDNGQRRQAAADRCRTNKPRLGTQTSDESRKRISEAKKKSWIAMSEDERKNYTKGLNGVQGKSRIGKPTVIEKVLYAFLVHAYGLEFVVREYNIDRFTFDCSLARTCFSKLMVSIGTLLSKLNSEISRRMILLTLTGGQSLGCPKLNLW